MVEVLDVDALAFAALLGKSANYGIREMGWTALANPEVEKVGPKGYIHGWVFVGAPGVGTLVEHVKHGTGKVTHRDEHGHVHVDFGGGKKHSFEHAGGEGTGMLAPRAKGTDRFSTHLDAAAAANRRGDHAAAAGHYRQAAEATTHPLLVSEMHTRADAAQAKIPGIRPSTATEFARTDISSAIRAGADEHREFPDTAKQLDALSDGLRDGTIKVPDAANRLDAIVADHVAAHGTDNHTFARLDMHARDMRSDPRIGQLMKPAPKPRVRRTAADVSPGAGARSKADEHAALADEALARGDHAGAINHLMVAAGAEPDKKRARALRDRQVELAAQDMGRPVPADVARRLSTAKPKPRAPRGPNTDSRRALIDRLGSLDSREAAATEISGIKRGDLDAMAKDLNIPRYGSLRGDELRREIVDATVGRRLDSIATRGFEGLRPDRVRRPRPEVAAERDAKRAELDRAKLVRDHTRQALGARMRGQHDQANRHLEAAAALETDPAKRAELLDARRGTPEHPGPTAEDDRARVRRRVAGASPGETGAATPPPAPAYTAPSPVTRSPEALLPNSWGGLGGSGRISYHPDGAVGRTISDLGDDAHVEVNGHALANELGRIATDAHAGRITSSTAIDQVRRLGQGLPAGSTARRKVESLADGLDAPAEPHVPLPQGTPGPMQDLSRALHDIPGARKDPREQQVLRDIADRFAAGDAGGLRMVREVAGLRHQRHESDIAHVDTGHAIGEAVSQLDEMSRRDRTSLHPRQVEHPAPAAATPRAAAQAARPSGDEVRATLRRAGSRDEARSYLDGLNLSKDGYKQLAREMDIPVGSGASKAEMRRAIVEILVGGRLDSDAIRRNASRPRT